MRDPLLVFLKKEDSDGAKKSAVDEVAKEVIADDDSSLEYSQRLSEPKAERLEASSTAEPHLSTTYRGIESTSTEVGWKSPNESVVKPSPEKDVAKSSRVRNRNTESEEFLIATFKGSRQQEISSKSITKPKEDTTDELAFDYSSGSKEMKKQPGQEGACLLHDNVERAITTASSPIVIHGATEAFTKYNYIPNEDFYAELRDFNKPTRWNKNVQKSRSDNISRLEKLLSTYDLFPRKFATFLIRTIKSMPENKLSDKSLESVSEIDEENGNDTGVTQFTKVKAVEHIKPTQYFESDTAGDTLESLTVEKKPESLTGIDDGHTFETGAAKNFDPLTMNPIRFRKELHALCPKTPQKEALMITGKRTDKASKTGAVPKSLESFKVRKSPKSAPSIETVPNLPTKRKRAALDFSPLAGMGDLSTSLKLSQGTVVFEDSTEKVPLKVNLSPESKVFNPAYVADIESFGASASLEISSIFKFEASSETACLTSRNTFHASVNTLNNGVSSVDVSIVDSNPTANVSSQAEIPSNAGVPTTNLGPINPRNTTTVSFQPDLSSSEDTNTTYHDPQIGTNTNIQYHDIPVSVYARRSNKSNRITNLKAFLKNKNWLGYQWKKFKHYKRNETARQQMLLEKIMFAIPQVDAAMYSAQIISTRIEILQQVNCDTEESLKNRNAKMKLLMSKLLDKTDKIEDLLETIRCNALMYILEANFSNSTTSKRFNKIMEHFCVIAERRQKSEGDLSTVGEDVEISEEDSQSLEENIV